MFRVIQSDPHGMLGGTEYTYEDDRTGIRFRLSVSNCRRSEVVVDPPTMVRFIFPLKIEYKGISITYSLGKIWIEIKKEYSLDEEPNLESLKELWEIAGEAQEIIRQKSWEEIREG